jgi:hypothetical protein
MMEDLSLHILDIAQNAIAARARRIWLRINEDLEGDRLTLEIEDDGHGMDEPTLRQAADPFFTTCSARSVGLGLSLLSEAARATGGALAVESAPGAGTRVLATFRPGHVDMKPLGDIAQTLLTLLAGHPEIELSYSHTIGGKAFSFESAEIRSGPGERPASAPGVSSWIEDQIRQGLADLTGSE